MAAATRAKPKVSATRRRGNTEGAQILISILLSNEGGTYIAQCLEWDIAAQGSSSTKALEAFELVFWARVMRDIEKGRNIFSNVDPAPDDLWEQFKAGMPLQNTYPLKPPVSASVRVPRAEVTIRLAA